MANPGLLLRSPAKLNWTLEVLGRRDDGFHELRSWFMAAGLYDELECRPCDSGEDFTSKLQLSGPAASGLPRDESNLVLRAEQAWRSAGGKAPAIEWSLLKRIPAGAGLGGGSGNAAAALCLLDAIGDGSAIGDRIELALSIGSDLPFFLQEESAVLLGGRGEIRLGHGVAPPGWVVLAVPDISVATGWVFAELKAPPCAAGVSSAGESDEMAVPPLPLENDLLGPAELAYPELKDFHAKLDATADFQLSGSGGTFFAFFPDFADAEQCAEHTRKICEQVFVVPMLQGPILRQPIALPKRGSES